MNTRKRIAAFFLAFAMILTFLPSIKVQADTLSDINIISNTPVTAKQAKEWAKSKGATDTFISLADLYWKYAEKCGNVNPGIAYVQAAKETGYGKFGGVLDESYHNPCGLKKSSGGGDYDPDAHQRFNSWDEGVQAHLDHLALYAGANGYPKLNTYDPRHFATIKGKATTVNSLGGKWAPSVTYGEDVNKLYNDLLVSSGNVNNSTNDQDKDQPNYNNGSSNNSGSNSNSSNNSEVVVVKPEDTPAPAGPTVSEPMKVPTVSEKNISSTIGWRYENSSWYYYKSDGSKATGWINPNGYWYYMYSNGAMAKGWTQLGGKWYYMDLSNGDMKTGWFKSPYSGKWFYFQGDGSMVTGFYRINGCTYFFDESGAMRTGWVEVSGKWYYFNTSGAMLTGWIKPNGNWYYMYDNGVMATGWLAKGGEWYYFYGSGEMVTGWNVIGGQWYYFSASSGAMLTGWIKPYSKWYYMDPASGKMVTGWLERDKGYYYYYSSGDMATGWTQISGKWYYMDPSTGKMAVNTVIDGWQIGPDGVMGNKVNVNTNTNTSKLIVIDPGHNFGGDDGAYSTHNGITYSERDLNMQTALKLKSKLESKGYKVVLTRTESNRETLPVTQSLTNRVNLANNLNADFFVSLHHNSADAQSANGVETYYSSRAQDSKFGGSYDAAKVSTSRTFATNINNSIVNKTGAYNRGAKDANLFVCRNTKMPSVLVELGFISNADEASKCANPAYQNLLADGIAEAIARSL